MPRPKRKIDPTKKFIFKFNYDEVTDIEQAIHLARLYLISKDHERESDMRDLFIKFVDQWEKVKRTQKPYL